MTKINKKQQEKGIYEHALKTVLMDIKYVIGILIALITAFSILRNHMKVKQFLTKHQWIYVVLAICFVILAIALAFQSEQENAATRMVGTLEPNSSGILNNILFSTKDDIYPAIEFGQSGRVLKWGGQKGVPMFKMNDSIFYVIVSEDNGQAKISTKIRGKNGLIAEIIDNEWKVNPQESFDRNYNKNALEVEDNNGDVVLQVRVLPDRIQFQCINYDENGDPMAILGTPGSTNGKIDPLFKYPSSKFFGQLDLVKPLPNHSSSSQ